MKVETNIPNVSLGSTLSAEGMQSVPSESLRSAVVQRQSDTDVIVNETLKRVFQNQKKEKNEKNRMTPDVQEQELFKYRAIFAVDDDKNVVIRLIDKKGKTIRQFPPEEYLNMLRHFQENVENLFEAEA